MAPDQPPFPTAWNLPFQPEAGIHTSILISESFVGATVAATRQNAGSSLKFNPGPGPVGAGCGNANSPAPTGMAKVMVVPGSVIDFRLSHGAAAAALVTNIAKHAIARSSFCML